MVYSTITVTAGIVRIVLIIVLIVWMSVDSLEVVGRKEVLYFVQFIIET